MTGSHGPGVTRRLERLSGERVLRLRSAGAQHRWRHYRATLSGGRQVFAKVADGDLGGVFEAEARGLRWLAEADAVGVPEVIGWDGATLVVAWVEPGVPGRRAAERFGRGLARLHRAGAARFGAPWPGYIAALPLPNGCAPATATDTGGRCWPDWYARQRVEPYLRRATDAGTLAGGDAALVGAALERGRELAGAGEPVSRIHGDCWSGNVLWSGGRGWLIDPAAHGGHRETDLAMLALFGAPHLETIIAAYQEVAPLAAGWRERVPLHQLHPLAVHVCLFGASYRGALVSAARAVLAA